MRGTPFVLGLALAAVLGGALGWATRGGPVLERPRDPVPAQVKQEPAEEMIRLRERKLALECERASLKGAAARGPTEDRRVAPKTLIEHLEFLSKVLPRKTTSTAWSRSIERFEAALVADRAMRAEFLKTLSTPGEHRSLALTLLGELSHDFLCRPEFSDFVRALARDASAQATDRVLALRLAAGCWEPDDPSAWATLADLAQFDREKLVRQAALSKLQLAFGDDPRTRRLLSEAWWREPDPAARAAKLLSTLPTLDPAERAKTIARVLREDRASEVKRAAASQIFQDLLAPERPMTPDLRRAAIDAALGELTPHADRDLRQALLMSVLAAGDEAQLRRAADYLAAQEPDAKLKSWGESTVKKLLAPGASRDEEFLRSLWKALDRGEE